MMLRLPFLLLVLCSGFASGAVLDPGSPVEGDVWHLPGSVAGVVVSKGSTASWDMTLPALSEKEAAVRGGWRGVVALDLHGGTDPKGGTALLEVLNEEGELLASVKGKVEGKAAKAAEAVLFSSEHGHGNAKRAVDGDLTTSWHSRYGGNKAKAPHWIGLEFGEPKACEGVRYHPRKEGYTNGVARNWRLEVKEKGEWAQVAKGESEKKVANEREAIEIRFKEARKIEAFRFLIDRDWSGGGFGTAGEVVPIGVKRVSEEVAVSPKSRIWIELDAETLAAQVGKKLSLRVSQVEGAGVVVENPSICRVHAAPTGKLFGRSNGGTGPDKLGAGLLGFDGLSEHRQSVLTVLKVRGESPATEAGLRHGDVIVAVDGTPLPRNDLNPGKGWHLHSHEAFLGKSSESALRAGAKTLTLSVLREGAVQDLKLPLRRSSAFASLDPEKDPEAEAMLKDLIAFLEKNQKENGAFGGKPITNTLAALALLATERPDHLERVKRSVEWSMEKYPKPENYGNLGFWFGGYTGILYSEYYLRTGDERVLPHLDALRDWAVAGQHESIWKVPALGHGPSGLPYGNKALVAPACHLLVYEALATRCGMESQIWEALLPYMKLSWSDPAEGGHGSLGYNKSAKDQAQFWSRSGLFAMACRLRGEEAAMETAMIAFMRGRHEWMRNSHAYGEPGGALGLLALNLCDPEGFEEVMQEYRWWFSLAWEPGYGLRYTTPHMGAPYMGEDDLLAACYALVLQAPKRNLHLTGKEK